MKPFYQEIVRSILRNYPFRRGIGVTIRALGGRRIKPAAGDWALSQEGNWYRMRDDSICWSVYVAGIYEPHQTKIFRTLLKPGETFVDAGANFGWYSMLAAKLVGPTGKTCSFEPLPAVFADLKAAMERNQYDDRMRLFNHALGADSRELTIYTFDELSIGQSSTSTLGRSDSHEIKTRCERLDDVLAAQNISRVDVMKCDVEGAERLVFQGAPKLLSSPDAPIIMFEANASAAKGFGYTTADLFSCLMEYGYTNFLETRRGGWLRPADVPVLKDGESIDFFAIKNSRMPRIQPRIKNRL